MINSYILVFFSFVNKVFSASVRAGFFNCERVSDTSAQAVSFLYTVIAVDQPGWFLIRKRMCVVGLQKKPILVGHVHSRAQTQLPCNMLVLMCCRTEGEARCCCSTS